MRKIKSIISLMLAVLIAACGMLVVKADTVIKLDGYTYMLNDKGLAVLVGWDNSSDTLYVPYTIGSTLVAEIGDSAFKNDDFIKHLDLHDARRMYHIGEFAFTNSVLEGELIITTQVTYVGTAAFENCDSLTSVVYGSDGGIVSAQCFNKCDALETVTLSDYVTTIKQYAFANCPSLTTIVIPKKTESIDATAFSNSPNVVIKCYYGSYAAEFAKENGIQYEILDPENIPVECTFILGDADGDGIVTIIDATKVQRVLAGLDGDDDGMIALRSTTDAAEPMNIMDATRIQRYLAGFVADNGIGNEVTRVKYYQA